MIQTELDHSNVQYENVSNRGCKYCQTFKDFKSTLCPNCGRYLDEYLVKIFDRGKKYSAKHAYSIRQ